MDSRRDFLQKLAASAAALPFIPISAGAKGNSVAGAKENVLAGTTDSSQQPVLRVAVMGLGSYGTRVSKAMNDCKRAKLTGVISGTPSKIKKWQAEYGIPEKNCYNYENYDQIKDNPDIDAVYVITPNALHHEGVLRAAAAGKHVICEKPMALNAAQGREMFEACRKAGVKLLVGYRMHFEPNTLEIVRMRKDGELGEIRFFQGLSGFRIGDPTQWRLNKELAGGGSLMDIGIYSINGARYMTGEEPVWVTAQETKTDPEKFGEGVDETILFQLGFPGGTVASCLSTYKMNHLDRFFLNGDKGYAELQPATGYGPIRGRTHKGELNHPHVAHQTIQMDEMAGIILEDQEPIIPVDGAEAVKDLVIIDAIYKACQTGRRQELSL